MKFKNVMGLFLCGTVISCIFSFANISANAAGPNEILETDDQSSLSISKDSNLIPLKIKDYIRKNDSLLARQAASEDESSDYSFDGFTVDPKICEYFKEMYGSKNGYIDLDSEFYSADKKILQLYHNGKISAEDIINAINLHELKLECARLIIPHIDDMI